jgi:hypothetical protein
VGLANLCAGRGQGGEGHSRADRLCAPRARAPRRPAQRAHPPTRSAPPRVRPGRAGPPSRRYHSSPTTHLLGFPSHLTHTRTRTRTRPPTGIPAQRGRVPPAPIAALAGGPGQPAQDSTPGSTWPESRCPAGRAGPGRPGQPASACLSLPQPAGGLGVPASAIWVYSIGMDSGGGRRSAIRRTPRDGAMEGRGGPQEGQGCSGAYTQHGMRRGYRR